MKKYILVIFSFYCTASFSQEDIKNYADSIASVYLNKLPGSIVIGINDSGNKHLFYYGTTDNNFNKKPDDSSIFEIGNITETFTCILFADRTMKGLMHIDDPIKNYLPADVPFPAYQTQICKPSENRNEQSYGIREEDGMKIGFTPYTCLPDSTYRIQQVLLCFLATHTSGLPNYPSNFSRKDIINSYANYTSEDFYNFLRQYHPEKSPGSDFTKSESGIALLGLSISIRMKKNFETVLVENLIDSMLLDNTRITLNENQKQQLVQGHNSKGAKAHISSYKFFAPAMGLNSSPADMMKFLSYNIDRNKNYITNLLDFTHNSRIKTGKDFEGIEIGFGWKISPAYDYETSIVWQGGHTNGYASFIGFVETSHKGVFILSSISKDVNEIGMQLIQHLNNNKNSSE
jgi:D-alanyl-D-alanine-carboxypeptidase/D-alanyl-D-alanine-endopeptidase